ncbi:hypothetical protein WME95_04470 [Sorangium sp. So ce327]
MTKREATAPRAPLEPTAHRIKLALEPELDLRRARRTGVPVW